MALPSMNPDEHPFVLVLLYLKGTAMITRPLTLIVSLVALLAGAPTAFARGAASPPVPLRASGCSTCRSDHERVAYTALPASGASGRGHWWSRAS